MVILTVEDEFLISEYLRTIWKRMVTKSSRHLTLMQQSARWKRPTISSYHGWAAAGCGNQRKVAGDPSGSRHGVYTAEAQRAAFGKLVCAETLWPEEYPYGGGTFQ